MSPLYSPLLSLILIPLVAALFIALGGNARRWATIAAAANALIVLYLIAIFRPGNDGYAFLTSFPVLPPMLNFTLGADGLSLMMLALSSLVTLAAVWACPKIEKRENLFYVNLLLISAGVTGAFASVDTVFFYAFHELALIPTFLLIGVWGSGDRQAAAWKATIYLALGSFILLLGLIGLYLSAPEWSRSFDMRVLRDLGYGGQIKESSAVYLLLLFGFGSLVSLFPFHTWAPQAYASAPAPAAMLHAGVLKKFGLYGILRLVVPCFPENMQIWGNLLLVLLLGNILYVGFVTMAQKKLDWMLGYSSVMHMGYIFLGIAGLNIISLSGASVLMFAHGLSIAALFALCGALRERTGTLEMSELGGLAKPMPMMGLLFGFAAMASVGLPGFANFAGELLVFFGAFASAPPAEGFNHVQIATTIGVWGVVISAIYMLRAYRTVFMGELPARWASLRDASLILRLAVVALIIALLIVGFYPQLLVRAIAPALL